MRRALDLAALGPVAGPNPRVGCVLLAPDGAVVGEGYHRGAGTDHAEVDALRQAGGHARGATAVVTLEPCDHVGRTPPCSQALIGSGIARVVFAQTDPHALAAGGAGRLAGAGVEVEGGLLADESTTLNEVWTFAVSKQRPMVTWKVAATLDGRIAAADGSSRWISGELSRAHVHRMRTEVGAVMVGTGTVIVDDPHLTARAPEAGTTQPLRVVVGMRDIPVGSHVLDDAAETLHVRTHDPVGVLAELHAREIRHVLLEGGPTLAAAFLRAELVDRVVWFVAPALLGSGPPALGDVGLTTIGDAVRLTEVHVDQVGEDARIVGIVDTST